MRGKQFTATLLLTVLMSLLAGAGCVSRQARHYRTPGSRDEATTESLPLVSAIFGDNMVLQRGKPDTI